MFLSSADGDVGELFELPQGCQGPFWGSGVKGGFLSRRHSRKGPQLAWRGESPGFSRVVAGLLSSYNGDLRDLLVGPQGSPVSTRVMRGHSGFLCSLCQGPGGLLELRSESQGSSPGPTKISGFLWGVQGESGPHLLWSCASLHSSRTRKAVSGILSG